MRDMVIPNGLVTGDADRVFLAMRAEAVCLLRSQW